MRFIYLILFFFNVHFFIFASNTNHYLSKEPETYLKTAEYFEKSGNNFDAITEYQKYLFYSSQISNLMTITVEKKILYLHLKEKNFDSAEKKFQKFTIDSKISNIDKKKLQYEYALMKLDYDRPLITPTRVIHIRDKYKDIITYEENERLRLITSIKLLENGKYKWANKMINVPYNNFYMEEVRKEIKHKQLLIEKSNTYQLIPSIIPGGYQFLYGNPWTGIKSLLTVGILSVFSVYNYHVHRNITGSIAGFFSLKFYIDSWILAIKSHREQQREYREKILHEITEKYSIQSQFYTNIYLSIGKKRF